MQVEPESTPLENTAEHNPDVLRSRRMWDGGPLRQWETEKVSASWIPYARGGYVGPYVCERCQKPVVGVYRTASGWVCSVCRMPRKALKTVDLALGAGLGVLRAVRPTINTVSESR